MNTPEYKIVYSRRRSVSISVSPHNGVVVRAPYGFPKEKIKHFVESKSAWISKHIDRYSDSVRINAQKQFSDGELYYFKGREYPLRLIPSHKSFIRESENRVEVGLADTSDKKKIKALLEKWYLLEAKAEFSGLLEIILQKYQAYRFEPSSLAVRASKSRWGSCSAKGRITINSELIKLDSRFYEYIIIHELCHLKHHDHGKGFYALLEEILPDYKEVRKDLKRFILSKVPSE
jgi:predicted metal-dependent hydrolase